jgi:hypothetical protein
MDIEPTANRSTQPRKVALVIPERRKRKTPLARRRRLNLLIRDLATDLGFDPASVTLAERAVLHQAATLMLQVEVAQDALVRGMVVNPDTTIRLSSEARRLLAGLRSHAPVESDGDASLGPLRQHFDSHAETAK